MKKKNMMRKAMSGVLSLCMVTSMGVTTLAGIPEEKVQAAREAEVGIIFEDNFDSYEAGAGTVEKMPAYKTLDGVSIVDLGEGNKAVQLTKGAFTLANETVDKQVEFEFKYDQPYKSYGGIYVKPYKGVKPDEYYFSLNPQFYKRMIVSYGDYNLISNDSKEYQQDTWYNCKAVLEKGKMSIKVWEKTAQEPKDWELTYTKDDFNPDTPGEFMLEVNPVGSGAKTLIDNLKISRLSDTYDFKNLSVLPENWSVFKPTENGVEFTENGAVISTTNLDGPDKTENQLQLDTPMGANWTAETHITLNRPLAAKYEKIGLYLVKDDVNWLMLDQEQGSSERIQVYWNKDGQTIHESEQTTVNDLTDVYFRLEKAGNDFNFYYSEDGKDYTYVGTEPTDGRFNNGCKLRIFATSQREGNSSFKATVEYMKITKGNEAGYEVKVKANDDAMGTVEGNGTYFDGNKATVTAKANPNYQFVNWTDEAGNVVSSEEEYTFTVDKNCVLTANFAPASMKITSFMADGLTQLAEIDQMTRTIKLRFASDTDLTSVNPFFYYDVNFKPSVLPYETMDLSSGKVEFDGWTILAEQNDLMKEFWVDAKNGNDKNNGESKAEAFATIERAQEAVRTIDTWTGDVIVHLEKGNYVLDETLKFTPEDSAEKGYAVIYKGAGADDTVISSGIKLTDWKESDDVSGVEGVYETDVPEGVEYSRDLYVGNKRAIMAQERCNTSQISNRNDYGYTVTGDLADMKNWKNQSDIELTYDVGWTSNILPVQEIKEEDGVVKVIMKPEPFYNSKVKLNCNPNKPTLIQGAFELLDEENEWYFDREAGKIYYIPEKGKDIDNLNIVLPTLDKLAEVNGEKDNKIYGLSLENIGFRYTAFMRPHIDGQIELQAGFVYDPNMKAKQDHDNYVKTPGSVTAAFVEGMHVNNCHFGMLAAAGFDYEVGVVGSTITENKFEEIGAAGMQIGGVRVREAQPYSDITYEQGVLNKNAGPAPERITEDILVMSNTLDTIGNNFKGSIGIWAGYVRDCTIAHNYVTNVAYTGISAGWGWGIWDKGGRTDHPYYRFDTPSVQARYVIENNNITNCMTRLNDGGAIYTLSYMPGSIIRGNFIHDIPNKYGSIYLDEGTGGVINISKNVVYNVYRPYFYHTVYNYGKYQQECQAAQHDNFFTTGAPVDPENPELLEIKNNAGPLDGMLNIEEKEAEVCITNTLKIDVQTNVEKPLVWSSEDESIATVKDGVVTPHKLGTTTIRVAVEGNVSLSASCVVTVVPEKIDVQEEKAEVFTENVLKLTVKTNSDKAVIWCSGDESIATVEDGVVIPHKLGTTTIHAALKGNEAVSDSCVITVVKGMKVEAEDYKNQRGVQKDPVSDPTDVSDEGLGYIDSGDWMEYEVNIKTPGTYRVDYRVAVNNDANGKVEFIANGETLASTVLQNTGGWQNWTTYSDEVEFKEAGTYTIRLNVAVGKWNINWFKLVQEVPENPEEIVYVVTVNGEEAARGAYNTKVTVPAPKAEEGKKFAGWKAENEDSEFLSLNEKYTFYIAGDMNLIPVYTDAEEVVEEKVQALLSNLFVTERTDGKRDAKFVGQLVLPKDYKLLDAGLIWSSKSESEVELIKDGKLNPTLNPTHIKAISDTNQFSVTIKGVPADRTLRGRIFALVQTPDGGKELLVYSIEEGKLEASK